MQIDRFGLVHLLVVRPSDPRSGVLEYRRQVRTTSSPSGETKWLSDIVDPDVLSETSAAQIALTVDDAGRPHIAYVSGKDLQVRYATRYDR